MNLATSSSTTVVGPGPTKVTAAAYVVNLAAVVVVDIADIVVDHTAAAVMLLRPPRDKDSKSGLSFALRRPGAEIIDILYFGSIVEVTVCLHADVCLQLASSSTLPSSS